MNRIKVLLIFFVIIFCWGCSGKLYNQFEWWLGENGIKRYYDIFGFFEENGKYFMYPPDIFIKTMDIVYYKYPETHISLEMLKQLERTDTVLRLKRPSLKTLQYSSQENYSRLVFRDSVPTQDGRYYWHLYRLRSPSTNNVFVFSNSRGGLFCVHIASDDFRPVYLKDLTFAEKKTITDEFETELLPKIKESLNKVKYLWKYGIWREDLE